MKTKRNNIWPILFAVSALIICIQLVITNLSAGKGQKLSELEKTAYQLSLENQNITQDLSVGTSLTNLSQEAQASGFAKPANILYLDTSLPVAHLQ